MNENTICLACPPDIMEDIKMSDKINEKTVAADISSESKSSEATKYSKEYILSQIEKLMADSRHISSALEVLSSTAHGASNEPLTPGDISGKARFDAIADVVKCRESTIQQALTFYKKVYDEIKPDPIEKVMVLANEMFKLEWVQDFDPCEIFDILKNAFSERLFGKSEESGLEFKRRVIMEHVRCQSMTSEELYNVLSILSD